MIKDKTENKDKNKSKMNKTELTAKEEMFMRNALDVIKVVHEAIGNKFDNDTMGKEIFMRRIGKELDIVGPECIKKGFTTDEFKKEFISKISKIAEEVYHDRNKWFG